MNSPFPVVARPHGTPRPPISAASKRLGVAHDPADRALIELGCRLRADGYHFTTVTPLTHQRVLARGPRNPPSPADIFGWSRPFQERHLPASWLQLLEEAGALRRSPSGLYSAVRFSTLAGQLLVHSAFPTMAPDDVFFGPDTYRFARVVGQALHSMRARPPRRVVDVGAGSGAGGLHAATLLPAVTRIVLADINPQAARYCRVNARLNDHRRIDVIESDLFASLPGTFDLIIANPPYLVDPRARVYRHGGGRLGAAMSLKIVEHGITRLAPSGSILLYTASAIVRGIDLLQQSLSDAVAGHDLRLRYEEIDPDVFGEELEQDAYRAVDRIAAVVAMIEK